MKKMLIAGNWKMNTNAFESAKLAEYILGGIMGRNLHSSVVVCPPYTSLNTVWNIIKKTKIMMGAQNCHYQPEGAYTGEVTVGMLKFIGCSHIIVGHSERRQYFGETDESVNLKTKVILDNDLKPIVCIGETLEERQSGNTFAVLEKQITIGLKDISSEYIRNITIAYEPVWAIGTGLAATPEQVQEAHAYVRQTIARALGSEAAGNIILYGGSMNDKNAQSILELDDVNGGLIGGASLDPQKFLDILDISERIIAG